MSQNKVSIIGIAPGTVPNLPPHVWQIVNGAEIIFAGKRLLQMFPSLTGEKVPITNNLAEVANFIKVNLGQKQMVVLASGDPGFYGIAKYLTQKLGKNIFEIIPGVSAMQLAFARIGENWEDAALVSVHSRPIEDIVNIVRSNHKVGIFTDDKRTPGEIARVLLEYGIDNCRAYVCQNLGTEEESIIECDLDKLQEHEFSPLNVVILMRDTEAPRRKAPAQQLIGFAEECFQQPTKEGSLITKMEIRAISLAKLALAEDSIVWDIGAGSGAVSIEASLLAKNGRVFAIEKNTEGVTAIRENIRRFGRTNVTVIQAVAPDGLEKLPAPSAIFIGGSAGNMAEILSICCQRLKPGGRIVINAATLQTLQGSVDGLKTNEFNLEVTLANVARSKSILNLTRFEALNPVFVIAGWRDIGSANA